MFSFPIILFLLIASIHEMYGQTTKSQTIGDNFLYTACGKLCDKPDIDAIAAMSVPTDKQFLVIIVRDGLCSWVMDMNEPVQNRDWGRRHHFKYDIVESMYTIFDDPKSSDKYNVTAFFTSGMVSETWRSVGGYIKKDSEGPLPLMGLGYNMQKQIDAAFGLQPNPESRIVTIIQNDTYYSFDLKAKKRLSGPNSVTKYYSYDYKRMGKLQGAFRRGNDIYFFSGKNGYYIWKSKDGKTGVLSEKLSVIKDFYKCDTRYTTTPNVPKGTDRPSERGAEEPSETITHFISDDLKESDLPTEVTIDSTERNPISDKVMTESNKRNTEKVDINVEPMTLSIESKELKAELKDTKTTNGVSHKVLFSIKVLIILVTISVFEYILK